jgi:fibro-slime domain-containing protein
MNRARLVTPRPLYLLLLLLVAAARGAETMAQVEAAAVASSQTYGEYLAKLGVAGTLETYDEYLAEGGVRKTEVEEGGEEAGTAPTYDEYLASLGVVNGRMAATTAGGDEASPPQEDTSLSFALDDEAAGGGGAATTTTARASLTLQATLRDFDLARGSTQNGMKFDFEMEPLDDFLGHRLHLVDTELGADRKPRFNTSACTTTLPACGGIAIHSPYTFHKWFHDSDDSKTIAHTFTIAPVLGGVVERTASGDEVELVRYSSHSFFPIPLGAGWGDSALDGDGVRRNFGFTTEIHTKFTFLGGEIFEFEGDDDVWVYLDGKLVLDMGGVHGVVCRRVTLPAAEYTRGSMTLPLVPRDCAAWAHMAPMADEVVVDLHLTVGVTYALDMFHAERHTSASNFALTTSMRLVPDAVDARVFTAKVRFIGARASKERSRRLVLPSLFSRLSLPPPPRATTYYS